MNLDELRTVQTKERQKDSLQHLRDSFYEDVADYIQELKAERTRAADAAAEPFSDPEVSRLTDEIETAEDVVEAIYERRVGKVVKLSSFAAADMPVDEEGLTTQERDLFEDLVGRIEGNKQRVLDILAGEDDGAATGTGTGAAASEPPGTSTDQVHDASSDQEPGDHPATDVPPESPPGAAAEDVLAEAMGGDPDEGEAASPTDTDADEPAEPDRRAVPPEDQPAEQTHPPDDSADAGDGAVDADDDAVNADDGAATGGSRGTEDSSAPSREDSDTEQAGGEPPARASDAPPERAGDEPTADADRTTVRITRDVGQILGMDDREYDLASEDVVTLPDANADALLARDAAERLD